MTAQGPYSRHGDRLMAPDGQCLAVSSDAHWIDTWRDHLNSAHAAGVKAERARIAVLLNTCIVCCWRDSEWREIFGNLLKELERAEG
jgi:hypothetical protein